jgi:hypothetical protein
MPLTVLKSLEKNRYEVSPTATIHEDDIKRGKKKNVAHK